MMDRVQKKKKEQQAQEEDNTAKQLLVQANSPLIKSVIKRYKNKEINHIHLELCSNPYTEIERLAKKIIKIKYISLGNLIVDRLAFKEYIQDDCNADALVTEIRELIENKERRQAMLSEYNEIRTLLGGVGASAAVAKAMIAELSANK